ncbi:MAG: energy transducer TonB, partial [Terriglobia bacterium]
AIGFTNSAGDMNRYQFAVFAIACSLISAIAPMLFASGNKKDQEAEALFTKARSLSDLEAKGSPPFEMDAKITLYNLTGSHEDGDYHRIWESKTESRTEISLPDYHSITVDHAGKTWHSSNLLYRPYFIFQMGNALSFPSPLNISSNIKLTKVQERKINGVSAECAGVSTKGLKEHPAFCFDPATGYLISEEDPVWFTTLQFSDYTPIGEKSFPRTLRVLQDGQLLLEVKITALTSIKMTENMLAPLPNIQPDPIVNCAKGQTLPVHSITKTPPEYPTAALQLRIQGTVVLYADIGKDGIPRGLTILRSPGVAFSATSLAAVSQWRYTPTTCGGIPLEVQMPIDVNYTIGP